MLIRVEIDGVTRHYCADCATESTALGISVADEGHWVGKGWCYGCGLVAGGKGHRAKPTRDQAGLVLPLITPEYEAANARLMAAVNGTGDEDD